MSLCDRGISGMYWGTKAESFVLQCFSVCKDFKDFVRNTQSSLPGPAAASQILSKNISPTLHPSTLVGFWGVTVSKVPYLKDFPFDISIKGLHSNVNITLFCRDAGDCVQSCCCIMHDVCLIISATLIVHVAHWAIAAAGIPWQPPAREVQVEVNAGDFPGPEPPDFTSSDDSLEDMTRRRTRH